MKGGSSYSRDYTKPATEPKVASNASIKDPCLSLSFTTALQFIELKTLSKVKLNEVLTLQLHKTLARVEAVNADNEVCGAVIKESMTLINCISNGHSFHAKVTKLTADSCSVLVQNVNR